MVDQFVNALMTLPGNEASESMSAFITFVIALESFNLQFQSRDDNDSSHKEYSKSDTLFVITNLSSVSRVSIALSLLQYAENLMAFICDSSLDMDVNKMRIIHLAVKGSGGDQSSISYNEFTRPQKRSMLYLTFSLLQGVQDIISTPSARKLGPEADLCLRLWQELMQTHVTSLSFHAKQDRDSLDLAEKKFWAAIPVLTNDCLDNLQNLLPVSHFLASVDSILNDDAVEPFIKKKTVRLLTDRVAEVHHDSPEHFLFLEMVPDLVAQLKGEGSSAPSRKAIVKQQGALIAIESFVSSLYPNSERSRAANSAAKVFLPALSSITELLANTTSSWLKARSSQTETDTEAECQLLSSCTLCISSLVANLKARCLHLLPQIIKPLIESLKSINASSRADDKDQNMVNFQLAIFRTISTTAEVLPGFLLAHLPLIFSSDALPAALVDSDHSMTEASKQLENSLATKIPARQLIPCLSNALVNTLTEDEGSIGWEEACAILRVINASVENASRSDLTTVVGKIFNGLVTAYASEGDSDSTARLLQNANKCLLSLVMKLSETQLRPLYARLREWRGDIDGDESIPSRRYAFWSLSAVLSEALKSIFFPCLTSVITDVVDELEHAVDILCPKKKGGETKRRKTEGAPADPVDVEELKPLQPLLLCLESALKADAHEGGEWTRGDDNQRYKVILDHLGKLLRAQVPSNMTILSDLNAQELKTTSSYQKLVQGVGTQDHGNVVGCLTALATAAGNEQLWKPLNFAVLEACGHKRSEVRKSGVSCLFSIIESIGEEFMVLLPECLPILSELLEDGDEDIASIARECVRQGEELLGESLEDNLR